MLQQNPITRDTPFVFMTGKARPPGRRHGLERGADGYLPKPFVLEQLLAAIFFKHIFLQIGAANFPCIALCPAWCHGVRLCG